MYEQFEVIRFAAKSQAVIAHANAIINEYMAQGLRLTLRQLYYQFVARGLMANQQRNYKKLGETISRARLAGEVRWDAIEDRTRNLERVKSWHSAASILDASAHGFRLDKWSTQPHRVEVWIEKEALTGVIAGICDELEVPYFACRGYVSQSEQWGAGRRFRRYRMDGQEPIVLHLGDHDPSGIDMTRDNGDRLTMFGRSWQEVRRLALNMDQVEQYNPPPNPAKVTDSRYEGYVREHGDESWELDALEPTVLRDLIRDEVDGLRDEDEWEAMVEKEEEQRTYLAEVADTARRRFEE